MLRVLLGLILLCGSIASGFALSKDDMPNSFQIKDLKCSHGGCIDLLANGKKIGALRRKPNTLGTFEFFDKTDQRQLTLKFIERFITNNSYRFDIYDKNRVIVAKLSLESDFGLVSFLCFKLLSTDNHTILASGVSYLPSFETKHYIFFGAGGSIVATLARPLLTLSRSSDVTIINKPEFLSIIQDPNVMVALLAMYSTHDLQFQVDSTDDELSPEIFQDLQAKLTNVTAEQYANEEKLVVTEVVLQAAADLLQKRYLEIYDDTNLNVNEKMKQFIYFGCDLVQSHTLTSLEEQAILQVLVNRLNA